MGFPITLQGPEPRRHRGTPSSHDWDRDSGYDGASNYTGNHNSFTGQRRRSNSRPPSAYPVGRRSASKSSQRDDQSGWDNRSSSEHGGSRRDRGRSTSGRGTDYPESIPPPPPNKHNHPPSSVGGDRSSQRNDQSTHHGNSSREPDRTEMYPPSSYSGDEETSAFNSHNSHTNTPL